MASPGPPSQAPRLTQLPVGLLQGTPALSQDVDRAVERCGYARKGEALDGMGEVLLRHPVMQGGQSDGLHLG